MKRIALTILCCFITACSTSPKVDNYILSAYHTEDMKAVDVNSPKVFLKPLIFPAYLDRPQMVVRKDKVKLEVQEFKRWAEPLKSSFLRVFREGMQQHGIKLANKKQFRKEPFDYQLSLEVLRFEVNMQQKADLIVSWVLLNSENNQILASQVEAFQVAIIGEDFSARITSQSQVIELLVAQLAEKIQISRANLK